MIFYFFLGNIDMFWHYVSFIDADKTQAQEIPHDDVIKWKRFRVTGPFVQGIHRSSVNSPYKGQWRDALMFSLICGWTHGWVNNWDAGDLRRHCAHYDVTVMYSLETGSRFSSIVNIIIADEPRIILCMCLANERRRYHVTSSLIGWAHT